MKYRLAALVTLLAGTLLFQNAFANSSPVDLVKSRNETVKRILDQAGDSVDVATKEKLKDVINGFIDFQELSRIALGKYWEQRSPQERKDFVDVFQQLIRNSSVKKLEVYKADRIAYQPAEINGKKAKVVTIAHKKRKQVEVLYKMHLVDGQWKVYDMEIDGLSTARNYRESFYKQIAKTSYKEMYDKLVKRLHSK